MNSNKFRRTSLASLRRLTAASQAQMNALEQLKGSAH